MTYTFKRWKPRGSEARFWVCKDGIVMNNEQSYPTDEKGHRSAQRACDALEKKKRYTESRNSEKA